MRRPPRNPKHDDGVRYFLRKLRQRNFVELRRRRPVPGRDRPLLDSVEEGR